MTNAGRIPKVRLMNRTSRNGNAHPRNMNTIDRHDNEVPENETDRRYPQSASSRIGLPADGIAPET